MVTSGPTSAQTAGADTLGGLRDYSVVCATCGAATPQPVYACPCCAGPMLLHLEPVTTRPANVVPVSGIWRRRHLLPRTASAITLGEGDTPLLDLGRLPDAGNVRCWIKAEYLNPTLSFKDRAMALGVAYAMDSGAERAVLASTGNAAVSAAAYCAAAGLPCSIFAPHGSHAASRLAVAANFGAAITRIRGDYSDAYAAAVAAEGPDTANLTTTYRNPILAEAYRTISVEIVQALGDAPDAVLVPVGAGPLVHGLAGGFDDARALGEATRIPRLIGVQAAACAPLATAWGSSDWLDSLQRPVTAHSTSAAAIADSLRGYEDQGVITLADVQRSQGTVAAVSEDAIEHASTQLCKRGILVEPASATTLAALQLVTGSGLVPEGSSVVLMLTGNGFGDVMHTAGRNR